MPNLQGSSIHPHEPRCASCRPCKKYRVNLLLNYRVNLLLNYIFAALTPRDIDPPAEMEKINMMHSHGFSSTQLLRVTSFHFHRLKCNCFTSLPESSGVITLISSFNRWWNQCRSKHWTSGQYCLVFFTFSSLDITTCIFACPKVITKQAISNSNDGLPSFWFFFLVLARAS